MDKYRNKNVWINWLLDPDHRHNKMGQDNLDSEQKIKNYKDSTIQMGVYRGCWNDYMGTCRALIDNTKHICYDANTCFDLAWRLMDTYGNYTHNWIKLTLIK